MPEEIRTLAAAYEPHIVLLSAGLMATIMEDVTRLMNEFQGFSDNNLTQTQRRRKIGVGIRNYGFIEKVTDLATVNPEYAQF